MLSAGSELTGCQRLQGEACAQCAGRPDEMTVLPPASSDVSLPPGWRGDCQARAHLHRGLVQRLLMDTRRGKIRSGPTSMRLHMPWSPRSRAMAGALLPCAAACRLALNSTRTSRCCAKKSPCCCACSSSELAWARRSSETTTWCAILCMGAHTTSDRLPEQAWQQSTDGHMSYIEQVYLRKTDMQQRREGMPAVYEAQRPSRLPARCNAQPGFAAGKQGAYGRQASQKAVQESSNEGAGVFTRVRLKLSLASCSEPDSAARRRPDALAAVVPVGCGWPSRCSNASGVGRSTPAEARLGFIY